MFGVGRCGANPSAVYLVAHAGYPSDFGAMTTSTGVGASAIPAALTLPAGVVVSGMVATSTSGAWTMTMTAGSAIAPPTFVCGGASTSTLRSAWPAMRDGQVGVSYGNVYMSASLGATPYTWSISGQPRGLTMGASGTLYGTPTAAGNFAVVVTVTDAASGSLTKTYAVAIAAATVVCPATVSGWRGDYYGTAALTGSPSLCRDDPAINFNWGYASPSASLLPIDAFSVRWTKTQSFAAGNHTFTMGSDDGSRLFIDGTLVLDRWLEQAYPTVLPTVTLPLSAGDHTVVTEYFDHVASARATLVITQSA